LQQVCPKQYFSVFIVAHVTAGCYFSLNNYKKTQELLDAIPSLLEKKKLNGKDLPTEVYIKKKRQPTAISVS
jgi:hypothetical protein